MAAAGAGSRHRPLIGAERALAVGRHRAVRPGARGKVGRLDVARRAPRPDPFIGLDDAGPLERPQAVRPLQPRVAQVLVVMVLEADQGERVPGLDAFEQAALGVGVRVEVVIEARRKGVVQTPELLRGSLVLLDRTARDLETARQIVVEQGVLAVEFGAPADRPHEILLHLRPVVLGLGIGAAEHDARVGRTVDVRDAPRVAVDRDAGGVGRAHRGGVRGGLTRNRRRAEAGESEGGEGRNRKERVHRILPAARVMVGKPFIGCSSYETGLRRAMLDFLLPRSHM